jgi:hypothetical protein
MEKQRLLRKGDIIEIKNGMKIYAEIPEKFVYSNRQHSTGKTHTDFEVGEKLEIAGGNLEKQDKVISNLVKRIREEFESETGQKVPAEKVKEFVESVLPKSNDDKSFDTSVFAGKYIVTKTTYGGGGTGMGRHDVYPDGHEVECKKLTKDGGWDKNGRKISFYQSGCFTAMITPEQIQPIGKMEESYA